jgi:hypothetical protein
MPCKGGEEMKEISSYKKLKVIKLFFAGHTYDEIVAEVVISKGSIFNVISEFKNGELQIAPNEYIDALRELAVDHYTIKKLQMYVKIDLKVSEMGVDAYQVEDWLDIAHDIATEPDEMKPFVSAALELKNMEIEPGLDCPSLVHEYKNTLKNMNNPKEEVVDTVKLKEEEQAELDTIKQARKEAQQDLENYLAQKKLTWDTVNTMEAILDGEFSNEGLSEEGKAKISKRIAETASLSTYNENIKGDRGSRR